MARTIARKPVLFIADPWDTLEPETETTLILARGAEELGITCHWATPEQILWRKDRFMVASPRPLLPGAGGLGAPLAEHPLLSYSSAHWRCDPPVTMVQMRFWSLLAGLVPKNFLWNSPTALLTWNEKYAPLRFPKWALPTAVAQDSQILKNEHRGLHDGEGRAVFKPAADAASRGVILIDNANELPALLDRHGPWPVLQTFDSRISAGETRVFLLRGKLAGALHKIPKPHAPIMGWDREDHKPRIEHAQLTAPQRLRATTVGRAMAKDGIHFATLDFIGPRILEINVTSPGLVFALGNESAGKLAREYWKKLPRT
jgi:glutathione synthase